MGLSDEERREKALYSLRGLRLHAEEKWNKRALKNDGFYFWGHEHKTIKRIIESTRQLSGMLTAAFDTNGGYWLMGESESGFKANTADGFYASTIYLGDDLESDTLEDHYYEMFNFAKKVGFKDKLLLTAKWWDLYNFVPALLYPVHRYQDDCFTSKFNREFNRLLSYVFDLKPQASEKGEKVLLLKHQLFLKELGYEKRDWQEIEPLYRKYREMSQQELEDTKQAIAKKRHEDMIAANDRQDKKEPEIDPIKGAVRDDVALEGVN